jgi:hypothetical protein
MKMAWGPGPCVTLDFLEQGNYIDGEANAEVVTRAKQSLPGVWGSQRRSSITKFQDPGSMVTSKGDSGPETGADVRWWGLQGTRFPEPRVQRAGFLWSFDCSGSGESRGSLGGPGHG